MIDKLETLQAQGTATPLTFRNEDGFITQVRLRSDDLQELRRDIDQRLWELEQEEKSKLKLGSRTRTIPLNEEDR